MQAALRLLAFADCAPRHTILVPWGAMGILRLRQALSIAGASRDVDEVDLGRSAGGVGHALRDEPARAAALDGAESG